MKRDWLLYALIAGGGYFLWKKFSGAAGEARDEAATAIGRTVFNLTHPFQTTRAEMEAPVIVAPTVVAQGIAGPVYKCPSGFTLRNGLHGPYCARVS